ncbi:MAG TPA: ABC transporter ATP-binding protein [Acidimicrobiales bacterium]|nr:ABC transporter ATP-binding protein [Acidimicrobiales bacterium]
MELTVTGVEAGYTHVPILHGVDLTVSPGECCGVLGANGAGKTTLLRVISGTVKVWRGRVTLDGRDITKLSPWARVPLGLAHVPEGRRVFGAFTVEENLRVAGLRAPDPAARLGEAYELFPRLRERRLQRAGTLSGGEQQMLAIARALMTGPRLLIIDEMSAGLAPVIAERLTDELHRVRERGISILLVEQNPYLVAGIADRVVLLERGRVAARGSLDELGGPDALGRKYLGVHT